MSEESITGVKTAEAEEKSLEKESAENVGFWMRFLAYLIDSLVLGIILGPILAIAFPSRNDALLQAIERNPEQFPASEFFSSVFGPSFWTQIGLTWIYFVLMTALVGATIGKLALSIKVVDKNSGKNLSIGQAILRETIGKFLSSIVLNLGYIWVAFDGKKQGWHDKIAGSYVVKK